MPQCIKSYKEELNKLKDGSEDRDIQLSSQSRPLRVENNRFNSKAFGGRAS